MSELTAEVKLAALEARVANLESQLAVFIERAKDDDEQIRLLSQRINEYRVRCDDAVAAVDQRVADALAQFGTHLFAAFAKDVAKDAVAQVTSETIADSLTKRVLVTRPAQKHELGSALAVRPAQKYELK